MSELTENALKVLEERYLLRNPSGDIVETPNQLFHRVADAVAEDESQAELFYSIMADLDFMPNSPTLFNAGTDNGTLSACFVLPLTDTMEGITQASHDQAMTLKYGGGVGFSLSSIRPKGWPISTTHGKACGPVAVLKYLSATSKLVTQGGRRAGAQMAVMSVHHPDILEFIDCKKVEGDIAEFNISVGVTDDFMKAVQEGTSYNLYFKTNPSDPDDLHERVVDTLDARMVFNKMVEGAWRNGEPGCVFLDTANFDSPVLPLGRYEATNPCFTGDTRINICGGIKTAKELYDAQSNPRIIIDTRFGEGKCSEASKVFKSGVKPVMKVVTREGYEIKVTADHKIMTDRGWVDADSLLYGDNIHILNHGGCFGKSGSADEGLIWGWLVGDGYIKKENGEAHLDFYHEKRELAETFLNAVNCVLESSGYASKYGHVKIRNIEERKLEKIASVRLAQALRVGKDKLRVPEVVWNGSKECQSAFLSALFTADGTVFSSDKSRKGVRLSSSEMSLLKDVQILLLNFGIISTIYPERKKAGVGIQGYDCKASHDLSISGSNLISFANEIGFLLDRKSAILKDAIDSYTRGPYSSKYTAVFHYSEDAGFEEVYDITVAKSHSLIGNGIVISNCGEQFLLPNESCNLGSINLSNFVLNETEGLHNWSEEDFERLLDGASFEFPRLDWERLASVVRVSVRLLDRTIDVNKYALSEVKRMNELTRRIGLGVMGWADALIMLGIPYDSEHATRLGNNVMQFIHYQALSESKRLAWVNGNCPLFMMQGNDSDTEDFDLSKPRRNSYLLTIAPTGTISMIAGCSSGIEPIFSLAYRKQNILGGQTLYYIDRNFERVAKARGFYSDELIEALSEGQSLQDQPNVPDDVKRLFVTSPDISPKAHVAMQAAFQEWVDNSISKTINMPNEASVKDVADAYMMAWETDCKGITVYRAGSRDKEILTSGHAKTEEREDASTCTECGDALVFEEGCYSCKTCLYSKCDI